ncbi:hypothetical protein [Lacticaseibacillus daqingensis]|uniref:hypothetical protein n=1 Tax=Lacticaseibacillus daqingensis TaxID=2486014 RepID=UPI000F78F4ED|nr:hypothetical protein [Lacticaseibacillus daqingensis]
MSIQLTLVTSPLYLLAAWVTLPDLWTFFVIFNQKTQVTPQLKAYYRIWRQSFRAGIRLNGVIVGGMALLGLDLSLCLTQKALVTLVPLVGTVALIMSSVALIAMFISLDGHRPVLAALKLSLLIGWRSVLMSMVIALATIMWLGLGYFAPIVNVLVGNFIFLTGIALLLKRLVSNKYHII